MKLHVALAISLPTTVIAQISPFKISVMREDFGPSPVAAANGRLTVDLPNEHATCVGNGDPKSAIFYIENGSLFLYGPAHEPRQEIYVDRSVAGKGKIGWTDGDEASPPGSERYGWSVLNDNIESELEFDNYVLDACWGDKYEVVLWAFYGPSRAPSCNTVSTVVEYVKNPVACTYESEK